jgi:hypothetical protein
MRILIIAAIAIFLVLWARAAYDALKRPDLSGGAKAAWVIGMLILPLVGLLVYTMLRPGQAQIERNARG